MHTHSYRIKVIHRMPCDGHRVGRGHTHSASDRACESGSRDCEKGKLAEIRDAESMDFSSDSEKKNLTE